MEVVLFSCTRLEAFGFVGGGRGEEEGIVEEERTWWIWYPLKIMRLAQHRMRIKRGKKKTTQKYVELLENKKKQKGMLASGSKPILSAQSGMSVRTKGIIKQG